MAQFELSGSSVESKSLIDASDRPLRRSSTGLPGHEEDWPVLQPRQSASPGSLQELMRDSGIQLSQQAVAGEERYPLLGNTLRQVPTEYLPISRYSAAYQSSIDEVLLKPGARSEEKQAPSDEIQPESNGESREKMSAQKRMSLDDDPFREGMYNTDLTTPKKRVPTSPSKVCVEPRQTRTSSLRARLSAGQIVNNTQSKVLGFTDFTAQNEPDNVERGSFRARKGAQARRSTTPPTAPSLYNKKSKDSIGVGRAPAQFVAGSRRPTHSRRSGSRGSIRNEIQGQSPHLFTAPPERAAPTKSEAEIERMGLLNNAVQPNVNPENQHFIGTIAVPHNDEKLSLSELEFTESKTSVSQEEARNDFDIYNDHVSQDLTDLEGTRPQTTATRPAPFLLDNKDSHMLEAIEESPQHIRRLSKHSPDYGPTLKISAAAEKFIMGASLGKESHSLSKTSSEESDQATLKDGMKGRKNKKTSPPPVKEQPHPSSSQGLSRLGSRVGLIDRNVREKKAKSVDLGLASPKLPERSSARLTQRQNNMDGSRSTTASKASVSTSTDPFFDAPEEQPGSSDRIVDSGYLGAQEQTTSSEDPWISPLVIRKDEKLPVNISSPAVIQKGFGEDLDGEAAQVKGSRIMEAQQKDAVNLTSRSADQDYSLKALPSTPQQSDKLNNGSSSHPPRSSSRGAPPDWTNSKKSPSPPISQQIPPPTPPKDSNRRRNDIGSHIKHASSKGDLKIPQAGHGSWRGSAARDSHRSQGSMSKGNSVLSNLKGLFHKRSSENEPFKTAAKGKSKARASIASNGSPFPLLSEIHPLHRPTVASSNRSKAHNATTTPRTSNSNTIIPAPALALATTSTTTTTSPSNTSASHSSPDHHPDTATLALQILAAARTERSSPKKERLLELGKIMVESISQARDAQKAAEEAKQAARRAEVASELCRETISEVGGA